MKGIMTTRELLEQLKTRREKLDGAIELLEEILHSSKPAKKRKKIIDSLPKKKSTSTKGFKYGADKPHWTQLPKNKKRVQEMASKRAKLNRGKKRSKKKV